MDKEIKLQVGVKAILKNGLGQFLLLIKSGEKYPEIGKDIWDIPGGRINPGVPLLENLKREIFEETGLELKSAPKLIAAQDILRIEGLHVVRLTYVANIEGDVKVDGNEHTGYKWVSLDELKQVEVLDIYLKALLDEGMLDNI